MKGAKAFEFVFRRMSRAISSLAPRTMRPTLNLRNTNHGVVSIKEEINIRRRYLAMSGKSDGRSKGILADERTIVDDYSCLLTKATARQLKGDIQEAICLANEALARMRDLSVSSTSYAGAVYEDIADTLLFLGKLHQLQGSFAVAVDMFSEAQKTHKAWNDVSKFDSKRKELVALSHLASAKSRLRNAPKSEDAYNPSEDEIEADFVEALEGLEKVSGWVDGMTNHTAHEWSLFCRQSNPKKALNILVKMKENLANVFGPDDGRVLQLNGEIASLMQVIDHNKISRNVHRTCEKSTMPEKAILLFEEALEKLPPNSPEALRVFMQYEDLKEAKEQEEDDVSIPATARKGYAVTTTTARVNTGTYK